MFTEDLSEYARYLKSSLPNVKCVGWLEPDHQYLTGVTSESVTSKLRTIILGNEFVDVHVNRTRSARECALAGCPDACRINGKVELGFSEIWLPTIQGDGFFASPSLVLHYIEKHNYLPPSDFLDSITAFDLGKPYKAQDLYLKSVAGHF